MDPAEGTSSWNFFCTNTHLTASELEAVSEYSTLNTASVSYAVTGENTYYWYVRTNCGGSYSAWVEGTFSSWENCVAPTNLATEVIDDDNILISWNVQDNLPVAEINLNDDFERNDIQGGAIDYTNSTGNLAWSIVTSGAHNGNNCMKSASGNTSSTSSISVNINSTATSQISFWYKVSSEANYDQAYFSIDGTDKITGISGAGNWIDYSYPLAAGTHTLRWYYTKDSSTSSNDDCFYVDDIVVSAGVDSWTEYTTNAQTYTFTNLTPNRHYQVKVKGNCGDEGYSQATAPVSFTTLESCVTPTGLTASNVTAHEATITWTSAADAWQICVNDDEENLIDVTETTYNFTGLAPETTYTVKVRTNCVTDTATGLPSTSPPLSLAPFLRLLSAASQPLPPK